MTLFNADEILEIAVTIERNGQKFYRAAAEVTDAIEAKTLLIKLADWEASHEQRFKKMKSELSGADYASLDPDGSVAAFLRSVADGKIFNLDAFDSDIQRMTGNLRSVFNEAIGREQVAVTYFSAVRDIVPEAFGKNSIDDIVREELSHIVALNEMSRSLKFDGK